MKKANNHSHKRAKGAPKASANENLTEANQKECKNDRSVFSTFGFASTDVVRRRLIAAGAALFGGAAALWAGVFRSQPNSNLTLHLDTDSSKSSNEVSMQSKPNSKKAMLAQFPLGFQWQTQEPFLFCVHHLDHYPAGNGDLGVVETAKIGREMGSDFVEKDGFRMYHGDDIPGFPVHPHRGFETVTIVRKGYADHADSMGAAGRYGEGDVQWMTAGRGVQHSEMFPLLKTKESNTLELFQIWLNLPKKNKMVEPHFTMFWSEKIPKLNLDGGKVEVTLIAGALDGKEALAPPPDSWASQPESETMILLLRLKPGGQISLPVTNNKTNRTLYFFEGDELLVNEDRISSSKGIALDSQAETTLTAGLNGESQVLILQSRPIGEPVVQHGPFVMTTQNEIIQTFQDYQKTRFGGWPWTRMDMVHGHKPERFAKYPNGKIEKPDSSSSTG